MLSKAHVQDLKIQCATLSVGQALKQDVCPTCHGGTYGERSFSVSVTGRGIEFCCHRASCKERGVIEMGRVYESLVSVPKVPEFRKFTYDTISLEDSDFEQFEKHYEITSQELLDNNVVKCPSRNSYVFPAYNVIGEEIGKVERWYPKWTGEYHTGPKSLYHKECDHPKMYVPKSCTLGDTVVIVEDCLSAIKVGRLYMTLALLGSSISNDVVKRLMEAKVKKIVFVLDPDAKVKSLDLKRDNTLFFEEVSTIFVPKDPKDIPYDELRALLAPINEET